jgi:hypothetical protein
MFTVFGRPDNVVVESPIGHKSYFLCAPL